jgi:[acyl-carrier-protein] S-malonyltransferase
MLRLAFVFPGQGAQYVGMGKELVSRYTSAKEIFERADEALSFHLSRVCFEGPAEELDRTEVTQPAILTMSIAACEVLKAEGIRPVIAAGLSLGEYSALTAAGVLDFEAAVRLVAQRGRLMQAAVLPGRGMMAAVLGGEPELVEAACDEAGQLGVVDIANYNCPGQVVISGEKEAVLHTGNLLKERGARVLPLSVSVPSHCRLMLDAAALLAEELERVDWQSSEFPVVSNVNARETTSDQLQDVLVRQLYSPVRWEQSVEYIAHQVDYFVEVGPGKVLSGFIRKKARRQLLGNVEDLRSLNRTLEKLKEVSL